MFDFRTRQKGIPGFALGILFYICCAFPLPAAGTDALSLAWDLFEEGDWRLARLESLRVRGEEEAGARLIAAMAGLQLTPPAPEARAALRALWQDDALPVSIRTLAAYALASAQWDGRHASEEVLSALTFAFLQTREVDLFWHAGCRLYFYLQADAAARAAHPALWQSLQSCRDAWPLSVWRACQPPKDGVAWGSLPARWIVRIYRSQIGPAIGSRCDLLPSCSEYFMQASRKHGLLGIPLTADRFIREPDVVAQREKPVVMKDGRMKWADPVEDHDGWLPR